MGIPNSDELAFKSNIFQDIDSLKKSFTKAQTTSESDLRFCISLRELIFTTGLDHFESLLEAKKTFMPKTREKDADDMQYSREQGFSAEDIPISRKRHAELKLVGGCINLFRAICTNPGDENIRNDDFGNAVLSELKTRFGQDETRLRDAAEVLTEAFCEEQNERCRFIAKASSCSDFQLSGFPGIVKGTDSDPILRMIYKEVISPDGKDEKALNAKYRETGDHWKFKETKLGEEIGSFKILHARPEENYWVVELAGSRTQSRGWFRNTPPVVTVTILTEKHLAGRDFYTLKDKNVVGFRTGVPENGKNKLANESGKRSSDNIDGFTTVRGDTSSDTESSRSTSFDSLIDTASRSSWTSASTLVSETSETNVNKAVSSPNSTTFQKITEQDMRAAYTKLSPDRNIPDPQKLLKELTMENENRFWRGESYLSPEEFLGQKVAQRKQVPNQPVRPPSPGAHPGHRKANNDGEIPIDPTVPNKKGGGGHHR